MFELTGPYVTLPVHKHAIKA